jgi:high-affinity nickel-transport protein
MAIIIGGIEILGLLCDHLYLQRFFRGKVAALNANLGVLGYGISAVFVVGWVVAIAFYKLHRITVRDEFPLSSISGINSEHRIQCARR